MSRVNYPVIVDARPTPKKPRETYVAWFWFWSVNEMRGGGLR